MDSQGNIAQAERLVHKGLIVILDWEPVLNDRRDIEMALDFVKVGPCTMLWPDMKNMGSAENKTAYLRFANHADAVAAAKALENGKSIGGPVHGRVATLKDSIIPDADQNNRHVAVNENGSPIIRKRVGGTRIAPIFGRKPSDNDSGSGSGNDYDDDEVRWGKVRLLNPNSLRKDPASRLLWPATAAVAAKKRSRSGFSPDDPFTPLPARVPAPAPVAASPSYQPSSPFSYAPASPILNFSPVAAPAADPWVSPAYSPIVRSPYPPVGSPLYAPSPVDNDSLRLPSPDPKKAWEVYQEHLRMRYAEDPHWADDRHDYWEEAIDPALEGIPGTMPN